MTRLVSPAPTRLLQVACTAAVVVLVLAGCGGEDPAPTASASPAATASSAAADAILDRLGTGDDVVRAIETLDQVTGERQSDVLASVRYDTLVLEDEDSETSVPIPGDRFYLSVAPYVDETHECFYHSLTTCQGELVEETLDVTITDSTGETLAEGPVTTYSNGFVGFWLPRDITATITVSHQGRTASADITTDEDAPTCLTTLQLT